MPSPLRNTVYRQAEKVALQAVREGAPYEAAVMAWRLSLDPPTVRSLAEDYRRGARDAASIDGYQEFVRRGYHKTSSRCSKHRSGRQPERCPECQQILALVEDAAMASTLNHASRASQAIGDAQDELPEAVDDSRDRALIA